MFLVLESAHLNERFGAELYASWAAIHVLAKPCGEASRIAGTVHVAPTEETCDRLHS